MSFELDHIWCFIDPALREVDILTKEGFKVSGGNDHIGQGTSNRSVLFSENYLELLYIRDRLEAQNSPLPLLNRALWQKTNACPFGIGLRGSLSENDRLQFWEYKPEGLPGLSIFIHKANEERPYLPLLFLVQPPKHIFSGTTGPKNWKGLDTKLLQHKSGSTKIENVTIVGPNMQPFDLDSPLANIEFKEGTSFKMTVQLDGMISQLLNLNSILRIS